MSRVLVLPVKTSLESSAVGHRVISTAVSRCHHIGDVITLVLAHELAVWVKAGYLQKSRTDMLTFYRFY